MTSYNYLRCAEETMDYKELWMALRIYLEDEEKSMNDAYEITQIMDQMELKKFREEEERRMNGDS